MDHFSVSGNKAGLLLFAKCRGGMRQKQIYIFMKLNYGHNGLDLGTLGFSLYYQDISGFVGNKPTGAYSNSNGNNLYNITCS